MLEKEYYVVKMYKLAEKRNLSVSLVRDIIKSYLNSCRVLLAQGFTVQIYGLASIEPVGSASREVVTLGYQCRLISEIIPVPYTTVLTVVSDYLDNIKENIFQGRNTDIKGIMHFKVHKSLENEVVLRGNSSVALKKYLSEHGKPSVRVHTNKRLKRQVRESLVTV